MHRLFVAIRPPRTIREQLLDLMEGVAGARWQDEEQLHLTLRFIGEVDGRTADDVAAALDTVRAAPIEFALDGLGVFRKRERVHALWAGVRPREPLADLHRKVDHALVRAGLEPERRAFLPHVTIARFGRDAGALDSFLTRHAGLSSPPVRIDAFQLYESHLSSAGSVYDQTHIYHLRSG